MIRKNLRVVFFSIVAFLMVFVVLSIINEDQFYLPQTEHRHQHYNNKIPNDHVFAGELVHFKNPKAYSYYNNELKHNAQRNSSSRLLLKNASIWLPVFHQILDKQGIPSDFKYVAVVESNLQNLYSPKGAVGFWQLKALTAQELGLEVSEEVDERLHPIKATYAACKFFKMAYKQFGSWTVTAAAYNRGMGGIQRAMKNQGVSEFYDLDLNKETAAYMYRLLAMKDVMEHPKKYGLKIYNWGRPAVKTVTVNQSIHDLKEFAAKQNIPYDVLKGFNPWLIADKLSVEKGKSYIIELPVNYTPAIQDSIEVINEENNLVNE